MRKGELVPVSLVRVMHEGPASCKCCRSQHYSQCIMQRVLVCPMNLIFSHNSTFTRLIQRGYHVLLRGGAYLYS